jgi:hypothetical protein
MRNPTDKFRQFGSIIIVTTDAILARCTSSPQPPGENRVARSIVLKKIIGSAEKGSIIGPNNRVGREPEPQVFFLGLGIALTIKPKSHHTTITIR